MLVRYHGEVVGVVGATRYGLAPTLHGRRWPEVDERRVVAVCEWALEVRRSTGCEPGRLPGENGGRR
jgi:hypothetical protein